jgi:flavin-dependent dehydrogenase
MASHPDVIIVGAGPAGATAALQLAAVHKVVVLDNRPLPGLRIGESLPPSAGRLLDEMGLYDSFKRAGHARCYANRFVWGRAAPEENDFLRDPAGHGWHIDRAGFELWLRHEAERQGARLVIPARIKEVAEIQGLRGDPARRGWQVRLEDGQELTGAFLIDAGGRSAPLARQVGAKVRHQDRLVCRWLRGEAKSTGIGAGLTYIEAVEEGWWYTAPLPGGRRVLAFHTDADLPAAHRPDLLADTGKAPGLAELLAGSGFKPEGGCQLTAASSGFLEPAVSRVGETPWLAAGDAALSFDPLSSQGLLNALFTGRAAARTAASHLAGSAEALSAYAGTLAGIHADYRHHLRRWYGAERRWPDSPFWQRRHASSPIPA